MSCFIALATHFLGPERGLILVRPGDQKQQQGEHETRIEHQELSDIIRCILKGTLVY